MKRPKKDAYIRFILTLEEKAKFEAAAVRVDQSLSDWMRGAARMRAFREEAAPAQPDKGEQA